MDLEQRVDSVLKLTGFDELKSEYEKLRLDPDPQATEILLRLLASGDVTHSPRASHALALRKDVPVLEKMKEIRAQLPQRTGLADYRFYVDRDIKILESIRAGSACHCHGYGESYGYSSAYPPTREQEEGFLEIQSTVFENYEGRYTCKCIICDRQWLVLEDPMGYHYTVWQWTEIPKKDD